MTNPEESGLERDYCAGQLSLRDLADIYGISEGAIRKRAKKHGWVRSEKSGTQKGTQVRKNGTQKKEVRTTENPASSDNSKKPSRKESDAPENTKPESKPRRVVTNHPPFGAGNQAALKHGGYARRMLWTDAVTEDARALTLEDELFRLRASNLVAAESIGRWTAQLEDVEEPQARKALMDNIGAADKAMMRNTVRIESIEHTLVVMGKGRADTTYREVTTEKVELEVGKLKLQLGKNTPDDPGGTLANPTTDEAADAYRRLMG